MEIGSHRRAKVPPCSNDVQPCPKCRGERWTTHDAALAAFPRTWVACSCARGAGKRTLAKAPERSFISILIEKEARDVLVTEQQALNFQAYAPDSRIAG